MDFKPQFRKVLDEIDATRPRIAATYQAQRSCKERVAVSSTTMGIVWYTKWPLINKHVCMPIKLFNNAFTLEETEGKDFKPQFRKVLDEIETTRPRIGDTYDYIHEFYARIIVNRVSSKLVWLDRWDIRGTYSSILIHIVWFNSTYKLRIEGERRENAEEIVQNAGAVIWICLLGCVILALSFS